MRGVALGVLGVMLLVTGRPAVGSDQAEEKGPTCELRTVYLDADYRLTVAAYKALGRNADCLIQRGSPKVELIGHTDDRGTSEYNQALGLRNARMVQKHLHELGVPKGSMRTSSRGESQPTCKASTRACRASNRRVELVLVGPQ